MNLYSLFWKIAKKFDPEVIHHSTLQLLHALPGIANFFTVLPSEPVQGHHIQWRNSIGIAAGLDKNAYALKFWDKLGIGCIEVGTVTPLPQYGNDRPRIFRIDSKNLVNAMGFPSDGAELVFKQIMIFRSHINSTLPIWINLGKQRDTPIANAASDYKLLIKKFAGVADALVINISSPNTADLRLLQQDAYLANLLSELNFARNNVRKTCPLLLKVSPDESLEFYQKLPALLKKHNWQGIIATNTTARHAHGKGGLSGVDLFQKSFEVAKILSPLCEDAKLDFVYVGGLSNSDQMQKLRALPIRFFQLYTAFIYQGPKSASTLLKYAGP